MDEDKKVEEAPAEDVEEKKDRTAEQFDKLTKSNQELKEERDRMAEEAEKYKKLYEAPIDKAPDAKQFANLNQQQIDQTFTNMVDENGFLDGNKLMTVLTQMNQRATQAEERAKAAESKANLSSKSLQERQEREAQQRVYAKYPQLNPENKEQFDPKMWRAVYNELAVKAKAGEEPTDEDYMKSADQVYNDFYSDADMSKKTEEQKEEKVVQKQQVNAVKPGSNMQAGFYADQNDDNLLNNVQQGKRGALAELLKRRGQ